VIRFAVLTRPGESIADAVKKIAVTETTTCWRWPCSPSPPARCPDAWA